MSRNEDKNTDVLDMFSSFQEEIGDEEKEDGFSEDNIDTSVNNIYASVGLLPEAEEDETEEEEEGLTEDIYREDDSPSISEENEDAYQKMLSEMEDNMNKHMKKLALSTGTKMTIFRVVSFFVGLFLMYISIQFIDKSIYVTVFLFFAGIILVWQEGIYGMKSDFRNMKGFLEKHKTKQEKPKNILQEIDEHFKPF